MVGSDDDCSSHSPLLQVVASLAIECMVLILVLYCCFIRDNWYNENSFVDYSIPFRGSFLAISKILDQSLESQEEVVARLLSQASS